MLSFRPLALAGLLAFTSLTACAPHDSSSRMASGDPAPMMMVHHLGESVASISETSDWYQRNLGFTVKQPATPAPEVGAQVALLEKNGFILELYEKPGSMPKPGPMPRTIPQDLSVQGPKHIAFMTTDVDSLARDLHAKGVRFLAEPTNLYATGLRVINIFDNNGNVIEIAQKL